jgi:hypothetical protein
MPIMSATKYLSYLEKKHILSYRQTRNFYIVLVLLVVESHFLSNASS